MAEAPVIIERRGLALATAMARKGMDAAAIGLGLPHGPRCASLGQFTMVGTGPGVWLVVGDDPGEDWPGALEQRFDGLCSVSDQSGGYIVFRVSGVGAGPLLQRGAAIDLHPDVFVPGSAATTVIAHIGVILWRIDAAPLFDVAVFRSYAASFRHWIAAQVP